jgi:hypothetical protein
MSAPKGHHGNRPHPAGADAQSLVLPRDQAGIAGQTAHTVHLAPLTRLSVLPALGGATIRARCPLPTGMRRSATRVVRACGSVSSRSRWFG